MPQSYTDFKEDIKKYLIENLSLDTRILDVGPGLGTYSNLIRDHGFSMDAVEIHEPYINMFGLRGKYDTIFTRSIIGFDLSPYDFIILGDVVEHISISDAKQIIESIISQNKACLVAVPFMMEQGEMYGNPYEAHQQPDLTPEVVSQRYPQLKPIFSNDFCGYYQTGLPR